MFPALYIKTLTKVVATLLGNSSAMIAKLAVRNAAFPIASTILMMKLNIMNGYLPSTLSKSLNNHKI